MAEKRPEPRHLVVGRILRPHGVRGELRMAVLTDYPERLHPGRTLYVGSALRPYRLIKARMHKNVMLLTLEACNDRDTADQLRGALVQIPVEEAAPLEAGEHYHFQVEGLQVETEDGEVLGELVEVLSAPGANDVYVVHGPRGEVLIPAIEDVILDLDVDAGRMRVRLLPGLLGT